MEYSWVGLEDLYNLYWLEYSWGLLFLLCSESHEPLLINDSIISSTPRMKEITDIYPSFKEWYFGFFLGIRQSTLDHLKKEPYFMSR